MPREPRDLSLINGEYRMGQSETVSGDAGDQPGATPYLESSPTIDALPVDANGEPHPLVWFDAVNELLMVTIPDGSGGTVDRSLLDVSGSVNTDESTVQIGLL